VSICLRRRHFIAALGGAASARPLAARAQQTGMPVVGYLSAVPPDAAIHLVAASRQGLSEAGFVEGRNVAIEFRWAHGDRARLPELAADLVRHQVSVIAAMAGVSTGLAAKAATSTIPIVFSSAADPVLLGLVASLNRPGGNVTGVTNMSGELGGKRLGLLHELLPRARRFAALFNPTALATDSLIMEARTAASSLGRPMEIVTASTNREIDVAFESLAQRRADALMIGIDLYFLYRRVQIITLAAHHRIPTIYNDRRFVDAGGLISYDSDISDQDRQVGIYVARILKGEKPADLPVIRATKFQLVINQQTARILGIEVPPTLLAIADEVIE
jgi:putative ABC transport system substrate-binding protein